MLDVRFVTIHSCKCWPVYTYDPTHDPVQCNLIALTMSIHILLNLFRVEPLLVESDCRIEPALLREMFVDHRSTAPRRQDCQAALANAWQTGQRDTKFWCQEVSNARRNVRESLFECYRSGPSRMRR